MDMRTHFPRVQADVGFVDAEMDIDDEAGANTSEGKGSGKIQKRIRKKRRSKLTFKPHPGKAKRMAKKK